MTTPDPNAAKIEELIRTANAVGPPQASPQAQQDRITATLNVYHQDPTRQPTGANLVAQALCQTKEQPYVRTIPVGQRVELELHWMAGSKAGLLVFDNNTGRHHAHIPTKEQLAEEAKRVVLVKAPDCQGLTLVLRPGMFTIFEPQYVDGQLPKLTLECVHGVADVTIMAFPR